MKWLVGFNDAESHSKMLKLHFNKKRHEWESSMHQALRTMRQCCITKKENA